MSREKQEGLQRGLKNRHIQMIALGGAIGTGLFYGSAETIRLAGPSITLSYLSGGIIIFLIMRMLGEMSVDEPVSGSFSHYANKYWGEFPGFLSGWNYWFNYIIVSMAELTAVGVYINYWWPNIPQWLSALAFLIIITLANLVKVKMYGEFEFWFTIIKVAAIVGMMIFGIVLIVGNNYGTPSGVSNLWKYGGFFPNGIHGLLLSLAVVLFSFGGIELIGITAGETDNPKRTIPKAINQVMWRILIFYIGALTIIMMLYPWNQVGLEGSPFVMIFSKMGIPAAATILNIVVLTAALSVYNSGIYSNGRMLYSLALQDNAPKVFMKLNKQGIPVTGVLTSSGLTLVAVILNYLFPGKVFLFLISIATIAAIISWTMIILTHLKFRKSKGTEAEQLSFKSPLFPLSNYLSLAFLAMTVVIMYSMKDMRLAVYILPLWIFALWIGYRIKKSILTK